MTTVKKSTMEPYLKALDERYAKLRKELSGEEPNPNVYNLYHNNPEQYKQEFRDLSEMDLTLALDDFHTILKQLKSTKKFQAKRVGK